MNFFWRFEHRELCNTGKGGSPFLSGFNIQGRIFVNTLFSPSSYVNMLFLDGENNVFTKIRP